MATRGNLGGLAASTTDVIRVLDSAARDPILVETVGVGQDEIDIVKLADVSVVVLAPGMGDDIQALKAGLMEIANIFVINKCDRPGVEKLERAIQMMLSLAHPKDQWSPPVVKTIATKGAGTDELAAEIDRCYETLRTGSSRVERQRDAARYRLLALLGERLLRSALEKAIAKEEFNRLVDAIADHQKDPYTVVDDIVKRTQWHAD